MVIRSYTAESVASALKQVRTEMGGEAVVLKTRIVDDPRSQRRYEVTACLDKATVEQANAVLKNDAAASSQAEPPKAARFDAPMLTAASTKPQTDLDKRLSAIENCLEQLVQAAQLDPVGQPQEPTPSAKAAEAMRAADVPREFVTNFFKALRHELPSHTIDDPTIRRRLVDHIESAIEKKLDLKPGDRVLVAGPAGAGKTSVIGQLAAQLIWTKHPPVKLISLDSHKVGAIDEIASYADLLGVEDYTTSDATQSDTKNDKDKIVLIDTAALPRDPARVADLRQKIQPLKPTHRLAVFSALMRTSDVETYAREMSWLEPTHLVFTMTDLTRRLGSMLSATAMTGLKIAMITNSSSAAGASTVPDAETIADIILDQEAGCE